jgi:hypothetical protein
MWDGELLVIHSSWNGCTSTATYRSELLIKRDVGYKSLEFDVLVAQLGGRKLADLMVRFNQASQNSHFYRTALVRRKPAGLRGVGHPVDRNVCEAGGVDRVRPMPVCEN